jgi:diguanylate cyclase (GGDEF)-like protein/PAS domain S-box-containing protein
MTSAACPSGDESNEDDMSSHKLDSTFYESLLDNLPSAVYFVDRERRITYWNRAAEGLTGFGASEAIGRRCAGAMLSHVDGEGTVLCGEHCPLAATMEDGQPRSGEVYLHHKEGHRLAVNVNASPMRDSTGQIVGAVESFTDSTAHVAALERVRELERTAYVDHLTGLMTRRFVEMSVGDRLRELERYDWPFGLAFLDVDHFKQINDTYGHDVGDQVLRATGATIRSVLRTSDTAGRWGGDEFLVVLANVRGDQVLSIANRIRALVQASGAGYSGEEVRITVSVGGAVARPGETSEALLKRVDDLMYASKAAGRNRVTVEP